MFTILIAKWASPGLLKLKILRSKSYDIIILGYDFIKKYLSRDSNYIVDLVM